MPLTSNTCWETHMSTMCFSLCWPHNWLQHLGQVNSFLALYSGGELLACVPILMGTQVGPLNLEPTYGPWPQHPLNSAGPDTDTAPPRGWAVLGPCGWPPGLMFSPNPLLLNLTGRGHRGRPQGPDLPPRHTMVRSVRPRSPRDTVRGDFPTENAVGKNKTKQAFEYPFLYLLSWHNLCCSIQQDTHDVESWLNMSSASKIIIMCLISRVSSGFSPEIFVFVVFENSPQTMPMLEEELPFPGVWLSASVERTWERVEKLLHLTAPGWQIFPRTLAGREQMQTSSHYNKREMSSFLLLFRNFQVLNNASDKCVMDKYWKFIHKLL